MTKRRTPFESRGASILRALRARFPALPKRTIATFARDAKRRLARKKRKHRAKK